MTNDAQSPSAAVERLAQVRLLVALAGLTLSAALAVSHRSGVELPPPFGALDGYLLVWLPLLAAVFIARFVFRSPNDPSATLGFAFRAIDLLWGLAAGLLLRIAVSAIEVVVYGSLPVPSSSDVPTGDPIAVVSFAVAIAAAVLLAPIIEEVFFRGLLLRSVRSAVGIWGGWGAVFISAALFAGLHLVVASGPQEAVVSGVGTFLVGLGTGAAALLTGRLGPAIVTHVVFNASVLVLGLTAVTGGSGVVIE